MQPGDDLVDLFPGTGIVGNAWAELSRAAADDVAVSSSATPSLPGVADPRSLRASSSRLERRGAVVRPRAATPSEEYSGDVAALQGRRS